MLTALHVWRELVMSVNSSVMYRGLDLGCMVQVVLEAKKRYAEFSETMGEQEMQHHGKVLAGQIRGFTATDPIGIKAGPRSNKH
jgi:hypothetical protein